MRDDITAASIFSLYGPTWLVI